MMKKVKIPSMNQAGELDGIVIGDPSSSLRGLVVIHEWWGMNEPIQVKAAEIARDGNFTVFVPDMYRGKVAKDKEQAGHYMGSLDWAGALLDVSASAQYLKQQGCHKVGVTGFCMGGALAFAAAVKCPEISASAPFYGIPKPELADLTKITIPVQGHFGEKDDIAGFSSPADYNPLNDKLLVAKVPFELCVYPAGHGFSNPANVNYDVEASKQSFQKLSAFMAKHLASAN